jgi:hypothetical protein
MRTTPRTDEKAAPGLDRPSELDEEVDRWLTGGRGLDLAGLGERCREAGFEKDSMAPT